MILLKNSNILVSRNMSMHIIHGGSFTNDFTQGTFEKNYKCGIKIDWPDSEIVTLFSLSSKDSSAPAMFLFRIPYTPGESTGIAQGSSTALPWGGHSGRIVGVGQPEPHSLRL